MEKLPARVAAHRGGYIDEQGMVVARGRNRLRNNDEACHALHRHPLAHAEVNALLDFPFDELSAGRCTLLTTTEPCPLCVGAARMCSVGGLTYAPRDPWAGSAALFETVPYIRQRGIQVGSGALLTLARSGADVQEAVSVIEQTVSEGVS